MLELVIFEPETGAFDAGAVEEHLTAEPFAIRDPSNAKGPFLLCGNAEVVQYARQKLLDDPAASYPVVCLVRVSPDAVRLSQRATDDSLAQGRRFAEWFVANHPCRIVDEDGNDYTEFCRDSLDIIYSN